MDRIAQALKLAREENTLDRTVDVFDSESSNGQSESEAPKPFQKVPVPDDFLRQQKIISSYINEPIADAYRLLRTRILKQMTVNNWHSLGITSPDAKEGKSLTAINLGVIIAMEPNHPVIVVDTDFRHPSTHEYFGIEPQLGILDYLSGNAPLEDIIISPGIENFAILPCAERISGASELLKSNEMLELVTNLRRLYPYHTIIYDLPPILLGDDAVAFSSCVDSMLLVINDGKTQEHSLREAKELLGDTNLMGTVLNQVDDSSSNNKDYYY